MNLVGTNKQPAWEKPGAGNTAVTLTLVADDQT